MIGMSETEPLVITLIATPRGCRKCAASEELVARLLERHPGRIEYHRITTEDEAAAQYGVVMPPMLIVGDLVVATGRVPREDLLERYVAQQLGEGTT